MRFINLSFLITLNFSQYLFFSENIFTIQCILLYGLPK